MSYKTTAKDFALFKSECLHWIEVLGLTDWEIDILHCPRAPENLADCIGSYDMTATIILNTEWSETPVTPREIKLTALHEALELLLIPLSILADARFANKDGLVREQHAIINRLIRVLQ